MTTPRRPDRCNRCAFTLLELMIVLAILTTVMLVAWPRIAGRLRLVGPREAALQLKSDFADARESAIRSGEPWAVRIEKGAGRYEFGPLRAFQDRDQLSPNSGFAGTPATANATQLAPPSFNTAETRTPSMTSVKVHRDASPRVEPHKSESRVQEQELPDGMVFEDGFAHQAYDANVLRDQMPQAVAAPPPQQWPLDPTALAPGQPTTPPLEQPQSPLGVVQQPSLPGQDPYQHWKFVIIYQPDGRATDSEVILKEGITANTIRLRVRGFTGATSMGDVERRPDLPPDQLEPTQQLDPLHSIRDQQQTLQKQQQSLQPRGQHALSTGLQP